MKSDEINRKNKNGKRRESATEIRYDVRTPRCRNAMTTTEQRIYTRGEAIRTALYLRSGEGMRLTIRWKKFEKKETDAGRGPLTRMRITYG